VNIQARNRSLEFKSGLIGHIQYEVLKEKDQIMKDKKYFARGIIMKNRKWIRMDKRRNKL
jgi:hypothetical protein